MALPLAWRQTEGFCSKLSGLREPISFRRAILYLQRHLDGFDLAFGLWRFKMVPPKAECVKTITYSPMTSGLTWPWTDHLLCFVIWLSGHRSRVRVPESQMLITCPSPTFPIPYISLRVLPRSRTNKMFLEKGIYFQLMQFEGADKFKICRAGWPAGDSKKN